MRPIDADVLKQHIDKLPALPDGNFAGNHSALKALINMQPTIEPLEILPSAQPEVKEIGYAECANAMLKMWIDNVLTDGEYNRIMDRLNAHHNAERRLAESEEKE